MGPMWAAEENLTSQRGRLRTPQMSSRLSHRLGLEAISQSAKVACKRNSRERKAAEELTRQATPFRPPLPGGGGGVSVTSWRLAESGSDP
jgi:hypothetical protein